MQSNLAVLILAHKNLEQLIRLIKVLNHKNIDVFVHLDKKWRLSDHQINNLKKLNNEKVYLCDYRISGSLFEWSLVEATMELIKKAKQVEEEKTVIYKYFALLSAQDYPIKTIDYTLGLLNKSYPKPFIDCKPYHPKNFLKERFKTFPLENKILVFFLKHYKPNALRNLFFRILKIPIYALFSFLKLFIQTPFKQFNKLNIGLYGGSQWWILPDILISEIYQKYYIDKDKIVDIISKTFGPDETFFQIMTMKSKLAPLVDLNDITAIKQNCLTYSYFRDEGKPFNGHPYILKIENFQKILKMPHCFARKFDETIDNEILNLIDNKILFKNHEKIDSKFNS